MLKTKEEEKQNMTNTQNIAIPIHGIMYDYSVIINIYNMNECKSDKEIPGKCTKKRT